MKKKNIWVLSLGHLITDVNQGALPAMLPFFIAAYDLTYTRAAAIVFSANLASSIIQPLFGYAADRFSKPWLLPAGLLLAGLGLGLTGLFPRYDLIMTLAVLSGIGIAAYHPEAARLVNFEAGDQKNTAMSIFGVGGTIGFAMGPFLITTALIHWGLKGSLVLILPVCLMALFMTGRLKSFTAIAKKRTGIPRAGGAGMGADISQRENWGGFLLLTLVIIGRSVIFYGLNTFIPIYWINYLAQSKIQGSLALTLFAAGGVAGNLAGGRLADKIGSKKVLLICFSGLALILPLFCFMDHPHMAMAVMLPVGFILYGSYSPSIVMGQGYLPNRVGLSSGITLGVAISIGGAAAPLIGKIADLYGIWQGIALVASLPLFILGAALFLPEIPSKQEKGERGGRSG